MSNYQQHHPQPFARRPSKQTGERGSDPDSSENVGQNEGDLYDQQQEARYAWNHDPDYRDMESHDYRGRVSFANQWPANGYRTQQSSGVNPRWQNNPSHSNDDGRGAYGLQVDQPTDYSLGGNYRADRYSRGGSNDGSNGSNYNVGHDSSGDREYYDNRHQHDHRNHRDHRSYSIDQNSSADRNYSFSSAGDDYNRGHQGRGPKNYERSDERVREDICERLARDPHVDASEITVIVKAGVVTLEGSIAERIQKHRAEDIADSCSGVKDVQNRLNVAPRYQRGLSSSFSPQLSNHGELAAKENIPKEGNESNTTMPPEPTRQ